MKRIISAVLSLVLLFELIPFSAPKAAAADNTHAELQQSDVAGKEYIADAGNIDGWTTYFMEDSTEYAGAVWTDKSVFVKGDLSYDDFDVDKKLVTNTQNKTMEEVSMADSLLVTKGNNNFLVSMSVMGSTKEITGYSTLPTDTVFVLDLSNSMQKQQLDTMIEATNKAIKKLLDLNQHNRIGIAVYGTNAYEYIPVDRYTTTATKGSGNNVYPAYIELVNYYRDWQGNNSGQIRTVRDTSTRPTTYYVKDSEGNGVDRTVNIGGGTYIQGGLGVASSMFSAITDTAIETGLIQGGTKRIPTVVLMTDGAPTYGTVDYADVDTTDYDFGSGSNSTDELVFATQLSAAKLKQTIEDHYGRDSLFYTLGLNVGDNALALAVMNPSENTNDDIDEYWEDYATGTDEIGNTNIVPAEGSENLLYGGQGNDTAYRYYSDKYFSATVNNNGQNNLLAAFDDIVETIILQSKYYPTLVETGRHDLDGYVTFEDELGEYMEVKDVKGLVLGNTLFSGEAFLTALNGTDMFGNASRWTDYGNELMLSISERLDIREDQARTLLSTAWNSGQLKNGKNYIGWYANASGGYLGFWDDMAHTSQNYPAGAAYLNKCYIFCGELEEGYGNVTGADMMHVIVQVHEEIATGHQSLRWLVPASLVPVVTYTINVNSNSLDTATEIELSNDVDTQNPLRVLYEVGVKNEINPVTLLGYMEGKSHVHPVMNGTETVGYAFYSNRWGAGHTEDITDVFDPNKHLAAVAHFHPSRENERYYYVEDAVIYKVKDGQTVPEDGSTEAAGTTAADSKYEKYTGTAKPAGSGYYHIYRIIERINSNAEAARVMNKYVPIADSVLSDTALPVTRNSDNTWHIPAGQVYQQLTRHQVLKNPNNTGTLSYYDYPVVKRPTGQDTDYHIYNFLGNNGRYVMYSAQGIKLTKDVDIPATGDNVDNTFEFTVVLGNITDEAMNSVKVVDINNNTAGTISGKTITLTLEAGETAYITGLPTGTTYTVTEDYNGYYRVKSVTAGTVTTENVTSVTGAVDQYTLDEVLFVNTASSHAGDLEISKTVTHPYGDDYTISPNLAFEMTVSIAADGTYTATGTAKAPNGDGTFTTKTVSEVTVSGGKVTSVKFSDGTIDGKLYLGHEDSVIIKGIPENKAYEIIETTVANFTLTSESTGLSGNIKSDEKVDAHLINNLTVGTPANVDNINIEITKNLQGRDWKTGDSFSFIVERYVENPAEGESQWQNINEGGAPFVIGNGSDPKVVINGDPDNGSGDEHRITFSQPGNYFYRITEQPGSIEGVTYDVTHRYFYIVVADANTDGVLEIADVEDYSGTLVTDNTANGVKTYKVAATFTNYFAEAVSSVSLHKNLTNNTGWNIPISDFHFELCTAECYKGEVACPGGEAHKTFTPNAAGDLTFIHDYTETDVDNAKGNANFTWQQPVVSGSPSEDEQQTDPQIVIENNNDQPTMETVTGSTVPNGITGTKSHTFTYYLWENTSASTPGMTWDKSVYKIEDVVTVTLKHKDNADGHDKSITVETTITKIKDASSKDANAVTTGVLRFNNTYALNPAVPQHKIPVSKVLNGRTILDSDVFTFKLYPANASFTYDENNSTGVITAEKVGNGSYQFELPEYAAAGTHYYVAKEVAGDNAAITYDNTTYHVTVTVKPHATENKLEAHVTINEVGGDGTAIQFTNTYTVRQKASVVISGDKELKGKVIEDGEFGFGLFSDAGCANPVKDAAGNDIVASTVELSGAFAFPALEYGEPGIFTYYVKEFDTNDRTYDGDMAWDTSVYEVVVTVSDNDGDGVLTAEKTVTKGGAAADLVFRNTYTPKPVEINFKGTKRYADADNADITSGWPTFSFELYETDVTFTQKGASVASFNAGKHYNKGTIQNAEAYNKFEVTLAYGEPTTKYYILRETEGTDGTILYDTKEYHVTAIVTDVDNNGILESSYTVTFNGQDAKDNISFLNIKRKQKVDVDINIVKEFTNRTGVDVQMDEFVFGLYEMGRNNELVPVTYGTDNTHLTSHADNSGGTENGVTTGDGSIHLVFYNNDLTSGAAETTKTYYVKEVIPENPDFAIDYDKSVYEVNIKLAYNNGVMTATNTYTKIVDSEGNDIVGAPVENLVFVNEYVLEKTEIVLGGTKELTGRDMTAGEFEFELYNATVETVEGSEVWVKGERIGDKVANVDTDTDADTIANEFTFPVIEYTTSGTYNYIVREVKGGTKVKGVAYDGSEYRVTVTVAPGTGEDADNFVTTTAYKKVTATDTAEEISTANSIVFANNYTVDGTREVIIDIEKLLTLTSTGKHSRAGFEFRIEHEGTVYKEYYSDKDGNVEIPPIVFTEDCLDKENGKFVGTEYIFKVTEINQNEKNMEYDDTEYVVKVMVGHDGEGNLTADITVDDVPVTGNIVELEFNNTYSGKAKVPDPDPKPHNPKPIVPDTGDNTNVTMWASLAVLSVVILMVAVVLKKKLNQENE